MGNEDAVLKGMRLMYQQNELILAQLALLNKKLDSGSRPANITKPDSGAVVGVTNEPESPQVAAPNKKKPWDVWVNPVENIEGEVMSDDDIPPEFKL